MGMMKHSGTASQKRYSQWRQHPRNRRSFVLPSWYPGWVTHQSVVASPYLAAVRVGNCSEAAIAELLPKPSPRSLGSSSFSIFAAVEQQSCIGEADANARS